MSFIRIYADEQGESHFEDIAFPGEQAPVTPPEPAGNVTLRYQAAGRLMAWHTISQRMYFITLSGEAEITVSDGETRHVGPGNVTLCEDTTGKGHSTRVVGPGPRICLAVTLA